MIESALAQCHYNIAMLQRKAGRLAKARASFEQALAINERQAREHPESPEFIGNLGGALVNVALIDMDEGRFEEAPAKLNQGVKWLRKALAAEPANAENRRKMADALLAVIRAADRLGHAAEVAEAHRELAELSRRPRILALDARLAAVLAGQPPKDDAERLALAYRAYQKSRHAVSARLFDDALTHDPKLGDDRNFQHRYNSACVAAMAASGKGKDEPSPDEAAKTKLRKQALDWLKAELSAWKRVSIIIEPGNKELVAKNLTHWKEDAELAGIRDEQDLAKLPEEERAAFKQLWNDVESLLTKMGSRK